MGGQNLSREWLDFAHMDLSSAEFLLGMHPVPVEIICYHCEQAAEKFLKAVLIYHGMEAPKTHDLVLLCKLCVQLDQSWEQLIDACVGLSPYGVQVRYPSDMELDEGDVASALRACREIGEFVQQQLDFRQSHAPETFPGPDLSL